jgi:hypothetical protein
VAAPVYAPGVAQSKINGTVGPNPFALIWHWQFLGSVSPWSHANIQLLADQVYNQFATLFKGSCSEEVAGTSCDTVDLTNATPQTGSSSGATWNGTQMAPPPTLSSCRLIRFNITSRYRGGHPRTYLPPSSTAFTTDGDNWVSGAGAAAASNFATMVNAIAAAAWTGSPGALQHVVPRYTYTYTDDPLHHKYLKIRSGLNGVFVVQSYSGEDPIRSQRRRLGK